MVWTVHFRPRIWRKRKGHQGDISFPVKGAIARENALLQLKPFKITEECVNLNNI